ncbi:Tol-Pal system protein TolB [Siculibacillus lacustris]|uniref:Tol-Pal system protein TolB n=1 Tax=Siculibacillus lacustris TaxID=1549641 RepID=A0A4Q9VKT7_9HYPH|nr:Tol-Pal system beta propeller repeat protein TolB [Siculibacillus lacustris]TBW35941.1 Tol-Pal system protein TolB [Siculibacillus lacustris]
MIATPTSAPLRAAGDRSLFGRMARLSTAALVALATVAGALVAGAGPAAAQLKITVTPGAAFQPMPIAVPEFAGDPTLGAQVAQIVAADLKASGYFTVLDPASYLERSVGAGVTPNFNNWRGINAQALVAGTVAQTGGQIQAQVRVWDVFGGTQLVGSQFGTSPDAVRRLAHIVADAAYAQLTGFKGFFDSRIVYVDETGPKTNRVKRLAIMDWDGAGVRYLTRGQELVLTPRFSPSNQQVAYMAYGAGDPKVFILNVATGARQLLGDFANMTFSPRFSPDGGRLVFSMQKDGNANIFQMDLSGRGVTQLTSGASIDTSPSFSPDGSQIVFESDRGGVQQLYVMDRGGGGAKRISFGAGRYATPVWSPDPDNPFIAFTKQDGSGFKIGVMKPDGSGERILADGFHNEGPTWAPNGRYVMFFREGGGESQLWLADVTGHVLTPIKTPGGASDPAWSPLLK